MKIRHAWCTDNGGVPLYDDDVKRYIAVRPSERQIKFNEMKYYNFIHFGMNTFTGREWGDGTEDPKTFNPKTLDTDQWCRILKKTGSKGIIFTAKHHDGFCLFDTKYTDHSVMHSPYGKDVVKELAKSCKKYGMKLGLYLSPWDRHEKTYGTDEYNDYFVNQLTELCTNYGELFCFWFDGACGEGANGKKQCYDWNRYYEVIRKYQPQAVITNCGPDVRWIGNEGGKVRKSEWSVIPWTAGTLDDVAKNSQQIEGTGLTVFDRIEEDLSSREKLYNMEDLRWCPAEADVSINTGWFWQEEKFYKEQNKPVSRTADELAKIYFNTVGGNASMLLNVPPDKNGLINTREIKILKEFTKTIEDTFKENMPYDLSLISTDGEECIPGTDSFMMQENEAGIKLRPNGKFRTMFLEEDIRYSQRVEAFSIYADGKHIKDCTCIGSGKIIRFPQGLDADEIDIIITQSRSNPIIKSIRLYK